MPKPSHSRTALPVTLLLLLVVGSVVGAASFTIVKLQIADEMSMGYEGAKLFWEGILMQPDSRYGFSGLTWHIGDSRPTIQTGVGSGPSSWSFSRGSFDLDPVGDTSAWQNLIGITRGNGIIENYPNTNTPLSQTVTWNINDGVDADGNTKTKAIRASTFFFNSETEFKVRVDESGGFFGSVASTEKKDYWKDFDVIAVVHINNWDPAGNDTSWARILGVEIKDVQVVYPDQKGSSATRVQNAFFQSQMLPLYRSWETATGQVSARQSVDADDYSRDVKNTDPSGGDLMETVYVRLPFSAFGVDAGAFDSWTTPQLIVTFRIHTIKVDKWIAIQTVAAPFDPSIDTKPTGFNVLDVFGGLGDFLKNPFNQIVLIAAAIVILLVVLLIATPVGNIILLSRLRRR